VQKEKAMQRPELTIVRRDSADVPAPDPTPAAPPLVHLRITGRHGVYLLQQGAESEEQALVDTRGPDGARCTCQDAAAGECRHIALLRACGFLAQAA
jgi:hypothetical protein